MTKIDSSLADVETCKDLVAAFHSEKSTDDIQISKEAKGQVLLPSTDGFEIARTSVWNKNTAGMPLVIVKCTNADEVGKVVSFAKTNEVKVSVHTAGAHSSYAVVDDSIVIDLSLMREVKVDPHSRTATVAGGATIGDVDKATKPHGLALPMGHVHHTGVAGMALNATSGVGFLSRTRNLTVTYLKSAKLVMADGSLKEISETENSELLWAIRGAGSNFGVAVEMVFALTKMPPKVYAGDLVKFGKDTGPGKIFCCLNSKHTREELVLNWLDFFNDKDTPVECNSILVIAPNGPVVSRICYIPKEDDILKPEENVEEEAKEAFAPLADYGFTLSNTVKMTDYWDGLQKLGQFSPSYYYQKAAHISSLPEEKIESLVDDLCSFAETCPVSNMGSGIILQPLGGNLSSMEAGSSPTADVFSKTKMWVIIITEFPQGPQDPELESKCMNWVRDVYKVIEPFATKDDGRQHDDWSEVYGDIYGSSENISKLQDLKAKYDGDNFFCLNRNILPK
jgi:hypothetical protein